MAAPNIGGYNPYYQQQVEALIKQYTMNQPPSPYVTTPPTSGTTTPPNTATSNASPTDILQAKLALEDEIKKIEAEQEQLKNAVVVSDVTGNQALVDGKAINKETGYIATDGNNDGKISFGKKMANLGKGALKFVTGMFTDEKGKFSIKKTLKTVAIAALAIGASVVLPGVGTALVIGGIAMSAYGAGKNIVKACKAETDEAAEQAWQGIGTNGVALVASLAGAKKMAVSKGYITSSAGTKTSWLGKVGANIKDCVKSPIALAKGEYANVSALMKSGTYGSTALNNVATKLLKQNSWDAVKNKSFKDNVKDTGKAWSESIKNKLDYSNWGKKGTKEVFDKEIKDLDKEIAKLDKKLGRKWTSEATKSKLSLEKQRLESYKQDLITYTESGTKNLTPDQANKLKADYCNSYNEASTRLKKLQADNEILTKAVKNAPDEAIRAQQQKLLDENYQAIKEQRKILSHNKGMNSRVEHVNNINQSQYNAELRKLAKVRKDIKVLKNEKAALDRKVERTENDLERSLNIDNELITLKKSQRTMITDLRAKGVTVNSKTVDNASKQIISDIGGNIKLHRGVAKTMTLPYTLPFTNPQVGQAALLTYKLSPTSSLSSGLQYDETTSQTAISQMAAELDTQKNQLQDELDKLNGQTNSSTSSTTTNNQGGNSAADIMNNWNLTYGI